ncbi:MAG: tryptophan-rich sensory protein [Chlamydiales bacterium]|nr:tryptophan-rich sensory protein [Chlamydiales bacterium]
MKAKDWCFLIGAVILTILVEVAAAKFTATTVNTWYAALKKPDWTPPSWIFAPVWTVLYLTMAVALFMVWRKGAQFGAYFFWFLQLLLNFTWSFFFFSLKSPWLGFIDILLLWIAIFATIVVFAKYSKGAAWLLLPYLLWVSYALTLNFEIIRLN